MTHDIELLKCIVCWERTLPPIPQCPNGHIVCSNCKPSIRNRCPICRVDMGDIRNLALEKTFADEEIPCRYHEAGCTGLYRYESMRDHENGCRFRPINCPYQPCDFAGNAQTLVMHLKQEHASPIHNGFVIDKSFKHASPYYQNNASSDISIHAFKGKHFCLHLEAFPSPTDTVYMAFLTFMGEESEAAKYNYTLQLQSHGRQLTWKGTPSSIRDLNHIRNSFDGLAIPQGMAQLFAVTNEDYMLEFRIQGKIERVKKQFHLSHIFT